MLKEPVITEFCYGDASHDGHGWHSNFFIYTNLEDSDFEFINNSMGPYFGFTIGEIIERDPNDKKHVLSIKCSDEYPMIVSEYQENKLKMKDFKSLFEKGFKFSFSYTEDEYEKALKNGLPNDDSPENGDIYCDEFEDIVKFVVRYMIEKLNMENAVFEDAKVPCVGMFGSGYGIFNE